MAPDLSRTPHGGDLVERLERLERQNMQLRRSLRGAKLAAIGAIAICAAVSTVPVVESARVPALIKAEKFVMVDTTGATRATLGINSTDGNVLEFYDSTGDKTLSVGNDAKEDAAALNTWDGNKIIKGTGIVRTGFGASNVTGFGMVVLDATGKQRVGVGQSEDTTDAFFEAIDTNGTVAGIGTNESQNFAGYFVDDLNGIPRQLGLLALDGSSNNYWTVRDSNGISRLTSAQEPSSSAFPSGYTVFDAKGLEQTAIFGWGDDSHAGYNTFDTNKQVRITAELGGANPSTNLANVLTYDGSGTVTGSLP